MVDPRSSGTLIFVAVSGAVFYVLSGLLLAETSNEAAVLAVAFAILAAGTWWIVVPWLGRRREHRG